MRTVSFGEIAEFINGRAFRPDEWETAGLPIIRIQNLTGSSQLINYYRGEFDKKHLVKKGDILISWSASLGVYKWTGNDAILNQHIFKVMPKDTLVKIYFYYAASSRLCTFPVGKRSVQRCSNAFQKPSGGRAKPTRGC